MTIYRLVRSVTYNEYATVAAASKAEARRNAVHGRRVLVKETKWRVMDQIVPPAAALPQPPKEAGV
jgi:hypothetical protein